MPAKRFSTPMIQCEKIVDSYLCHAMLPGKKIPGGQSLELTQVTKTPDWKIDSVHVNGIAIESKKFQMSRAVDIKCKISIGKELFCE